MDTSQNNLDRFFGEPVYKNRREELVDKFVQAINEERVGTPYKPVTHRLIALRINSHPLLKKDLGEVEYLYKQCIQQGNFKKFWWVTK